MGHIVGESRDQRQLLAPSLEELVAADHPVRVIDAFVATLDLRSLGFDKVVACATGRPPYEPGDLLKLYVYGYCNQMRSSRRLEREAARNIEVHWLINRLQPSFKTIAEFRKQHPAAIVEVTGAFVGFCRRQSLFAGELVAIDGTKIEAVASRKKVVMPKQLGKQVAAIEAKIASYLAAMDAADREEDGLPAGDVKAALVALEHQRDQLQAQLKTLVDEGVSQKVAGEPEARLMRTPRGHRVAYNAQSAVDGGHGLIAAFDLTNECNDLRLLRPMAAAAKAALAADTLKVVADSGYSNGEHAKDCREAGITAVVPRAETRNPKNPRLFSRDAFAYDAASDSWTCPAGALLTVYKRSQTQKTTYYTTKACTRCALKPQCTDAEKRSLARHFHEDDMQAMHQRAIDDPSLMQRRRELAEHPFAVIKAMLGRPRFLLRGLEKAKSELALAVLGFNLKRAVTILGVPALLAALQPQPA